MTASRIAHLFSLFVNNDCTPDERQELIALLNDPQHEAEFKRLIQNLMDTTGDEIEMPKEKAEWILANVLQAEKGRVAHMRTRNAFLTKGVGVAAAAVLIICLGGLSLWFFQNNKLGKTNESVGVTPKPLPVLPGTDKATLTMADGSTIILENARNGVLAAAEHINIQKRGALLVYNPTALPGEKNRVTFNTLSTPRGGQYRVVLSDGSGVWLNAASSLRFPTAFTGDSREVELTGEAYFEVATDKQKPFHVVVNGMRVKVLGTHFNINAYSQEQAIRTSLLEGSVQVINGSFSSRIKPGEQAIVRRKDDVISVRTANMDAVVAWKNGLFEFDGADVATIMRQISRWYDVEIVYAGKVPARQFEGKISRSAQLSDVLKILELSNIHFKVEGKKIIVQ